MMIYITVFRCIYVKVFNYTYFLIKKNRIKIFFYDKTSGARPLNEARIQLLYLFTDINLYTSSASLCFMK